MQGSSNPESMPSGVGRTPAMPGPPLPEPPETLHSQTDSFLTAARLVRRGWVEEEKKTGWQISSFNHSAHHPRLTKSDGNQVSNRAEICLKDPWSRRVSDANSRKTAEDRETDFEKKADEVKQTAEGISSGYRQAERQKGIVFIWTSGCRNKCRQPLRFKAPILPVIAEM